MTAGLDKIAARFRPFWEGLTVSGKAAVVIAPVAIVMSVFLFLSDGSGKYVAVCEGVRDRAIVFALADGLEQSDIPHEISTDGHSVFVPLECISRATGIYAAVVKKGHKSEVESGGSFLSNPIFNPLVSTRDRQRQARQRELASGICIYPEIARARVMITPPDTRIFADRKDKYPCATVILEPAQNKAVSPCTIQRIRKLVASGYQGLSEERVSISDSTGRDYNMVASSASGSDEERIRVQQEKAEKLLQKKVHRHLSVLFGEENISVAASVVMNKYEGTRKGKVGNICLSVFINENNRHFSHISPKLANSIIESVSNLARIDKNRGDYVCVKVIPFDRTDHRGETSHKSSTEPLKKPGSNNSVGGRKKSVGDNESSVAGRQKFVGGNEKPVLCSVSGAIVSQTAVLSPSAPTISSTSILLSSSGYLKNSSFDDVNLSPSAFILPVIVMGFCLFYIIWRRRLTSAVVDDSEALLWQPVTDFNFSDIEGTYCSLPDYAQVGDYDDRIYKEDILSRTAEEDPQVIADLIRHNENLRSREW